MNKIFSKNIFKNTLKELSLVSILMGIVSVAVTVLLVGSNFGYEGGIYTRYYYFNIPYFRGEPIAISIAPVLIIFMFLGAATIAFLAFKYQNNRVLADKYHSLPTSRSQQFVSRIAAVLTVVYSVIIITILSSWITLLATGTSFTPSYIVFNLLGYMAGSTLIVGIVACAMSFTGNAFANITVGMLLLFLPRCILTFSVIRVDDVIRQFINIGTLNMFVNPITNIPVGMVLDQSRVWEYFGMSETLINPVSIVYTFILGLLYIAIAWLISKKRKSELAGKSFMHPWHSAIAASLCVMPLVLLAGYNAFDGLTPFDIDRVMLIMLGFAIFINLVLIVIYNAGLKQIGKGAIAFVSVIVLTAVISLAAQGIVENIASAKLDADDVEYVNFNLSYEKQYKNNPTYLYGALLFKDVKIVDEDVIEAAVDSMNDYIDVSMENREKIKAGQNYTATSYYDALWCEFHLKNGKTVTRILHMKNDKNYSTLLRFLETQDVLWKLAPLDEEYTTELNFGEFGYDSEDLSRQMYEMYYNELGGYRQLNPQRGPYFSESLHDIYRENYNDLSITSFYVGGDIDNVAYTAYYSLNRGTPETSNAYLKLVNEIYGKKVVEKVEKIQTNPEDVLVYNIEGTLISRDDTQETRNYNNRLYYRSGAEEGMEISDMISKEYADELLNLITNTDLSSISIDDNYLQLYVYVQFDDMNEDDYYRQPSIYVPITDIQYEYWQAVITELLSDMAMG